MKKIDDIITSLIFKVFIPRLEKEGKKEYEIANEIISIFLNHATWWLLLVTRHSDREKIILKVNEITNEWKRQTIEAEQKARANRNINSSIEVKIFKENEN